MLRAGGFLFTEHIRKNNDRPPITIGDIDPLRGCASTRRGDNVDEVSIHISGTKTD